MRLCSIASGSSGNCTYVGSDCTHVLVDVGISGKRVESGLNTLGITARDVDGILITHEHADHVAGLGVLARKYDIPIYATKGTIKAIQCMKQVGDIDPELFCEIREDEKFILKDLTVNPMRMSHDAAQPVAYRISYGSKKVGICTDLGVFDEYTVDCLRGMDAVLIEANHDVNMLQVGPYPYYLKQRILGDRGHLSNFDASGLVRRFARPKLKALALAHLSEECNAPHLARESAAEALRDAGLHDVRLSVLRQDGPVEIWKS